MEQRALPVRGRMLPGLGDRLLDALTRSGAPPAATSTTPGGFVALYRDAIERLEAQVARGNGHPPMRKQEVDLMCRCLLSCATLADAIRCAAEFCEMLTPRAGVLSLAVHDGRATFRMDSLRRMRSPAACLVDLTGLFCYLQLFGWLIGQPLRPDEVWLGHPRRDDAMPLLGLFNAPVQVGCMTYGFAFDAARLDARVIRQPGELAAFLVDFPFRLIDAAPAVVSWAQQVRGFLDAALAREQALPALAELATWLGVSAATLRRRLAAEGSGYHALREQCLASVARHCLRESDWPVARIAAHLGFGGEEAFRRAFVRWTGVAPSRFRRDCRAAGAPFRLM
ncbi:AraC family transcriptional regulator [Burkholderia diffusa]|uniref:AraC family transcriptional regulator n=1 Tax=Burkholderia diffusa TaxID=488732 RepID=A0AAW3PDN2_9BURK|nr:AraC family transcriptional regulator [Burkholderia diffusa]KVC39604.1 AraC family transcriptional regulator [Burkholderia diffusa]KWF31758.1 AraC family transcriptional regulator [Burkholderia diffusa]KWF35191.1 AraC family transcriptional regulator [Burkholderia diffusa]KWF48607.1 AraC family transcriptional regulator [Burkholderia diffusa]KWF51459.1 AraC family transcriptional regulator [Burkholderia diffusa]